MKKSSNRNIFISYSLLLCACLASARSVHRPVDPYMPELNVSWVGDSQVHTLRNYHLEEYALFKLFDKDFFEQNLLAKKPLTYRYEPQKSVDYETIQSYIDILIGELKDNKRKFAYFTVLQDKDFNYKKCHGLIVVKFNEHPFVVKLFMENPESFINPFDKGLEPIFFFFMAGGINRHIAGFTRLKNLAMIQQTLKESPQWKDAVSLPRKWFFLPKNAQWIKLVGKNIDSKKNCQIEIPGTYCIIADFMEAERSFSLFSATDKKTAMQLCNFLHLWIDPHITNFMIEKNTGKIIIVDTEHFPSFVGLKEEITFNSYTEWYLYLAGKCFKNEFLLTKKERRNPKKNSPLMTLA